MPHPRNRETARPTRIVLPLASAASICSGRSSRLPVSDDCIEPRSERTSRASACRATRGKTFSPFRHSGRRRWQSQSSSQSSSASDSAKRGRAPEPYDANGPGGLIRRLRVPFKTKRR